MSGNNSYIADNSRPAIERRHSGPFTIGVLANRQVFEATSIVRYEQAVFYGIRAAARAYDCNVLLACGVGPDAVPYERRPAWPLDRRDTNWIPVGPWNTSGLLVVPPFTDAQADALARWQARGHPIICTSPHAPYPSVGAANDEGIAQALAHLVAHGHRRVAFIAADPYPVGDGAERLVAFHTAAHAHGLPVDPALIAYGGHNEEESYTAVRDLLDAGADFTAVLASNDESAVGALRALADAGRRVPDDVAVIGFDDVLHAKAQTPPLTTVRLPSFDLGYRAVELLLDYVARRRVEPTTVRVPTRLIVRESCGCRLSGAPGVLSRDAPPQPLLDRDTLIRNVAGALSAETQRSATALVDAWSAALVSTFIAALEHGAGRLYDTQLDRLLHEVEAANEDLFPWQAAISVLHTQLPRCSRRTNSACRGVRPNGSSTRLASRSANASAASIPAFACAKPSSPTGSEA